MNEKKDECDRIVGLFRADVASVNNLMTLDRYIIDFGKSALSSLVENITKYNLNALALKEVKNTLAAFNNIEQSGSLKKQYESINNQCLVLLVSYFELAVGRLFKEFMVDGLRKLPPGATKLDAIKVTFNDLMLADFDLQKSIGPIIARDISFQDMQSIARSFKSYYNFDIEQDQTVNNIIAAHGCRHVIVHQGGIVNRKTMKQVENAFPRDIKPTMYEGEPIWFSRSEVKAVETNMNTYVEKIANYLNVNIFS